MSLSKCRVGFALVGGVVTGSWLVFFVYVFVHFSNEGGNVKIEANKFRFSFQTCCNKSNEFDKFIVHACEARRRILAVFEVNVRINFVNNTSY